MIASFIAQGAVGAWLVESSALVLAAWAAVFTARTLGASAALRHFLWLLAFMSAMALPIAAALTPVRVALLPILTDPASQGVVAAQAPASWTLVDALFGLYALVAAALLLRLAVGQRRLSAMWRAARPAGGIEGEAAAAAREIGLQRRIAVRIADDATTPMTWGTVFPKIVLPASAMAWPRARRRLVLMHEMAHVKRADSAVQLLVSLTLALCWFHPALWFAAARLRLEQEHASDERVLLAGAAPHAYARALLDVAAASTRSFAATAVAMVGPSQLETRVTAIVDGRPRTFSVVGAGAAMSWAFGALLAAVLVAPVTPAARAETLAEMLAQAVPATDDADSRSAPRPDPEEVENLPDLTGAPARRVRRVAPTSPSQTSPLSPLAPLPAVAAILDIPATPAIPASPATPATPPALPTLPEPGRRSD